jgi:hypothetical protein
MVAILQAVTIRTSRSLVLNKLALTVHQWIHDGIPLDTHAAKRYRYIILGNYFRWHEGQ